MEWSNDFSSPNPKALPSVYLTDFKIVTQIGNQRLIQSIDSFIHPFNKYLVTIYHVPYIGDTLFPKTKSYLRRVCVPVVGGKG